MYMALVFALLFTQQPEMKDVETENLIEINTFMRLYTLWAKNSLLRFVHSVAIS